MRVIFDNKKVYKSLFGQVLEAIKQSKYIDNRDLI